MVFTFYNFIKMVKSKLKSIITYVQQNFVQSVMFNFLLFQTFIFIPLFLNSLSPLKLNANVIFLMISVLCLVNVVFSVLLIYVAISLRLYKNRLIQFISGYIIVSLICALFFTLKFETPPLHDASSHSLWAAWILESGEIKQFYSPLLHSLVAFIAAISNLTVPKVVSFVSLTIALLIPVGWTVFLSKLLKPRGSLYLFICFVILVSLHYPLELIPLAGKNSLILAIFNSAIFLYFLITFKLKKTLITYVSFFLSLLLVFFSHYPAFVFIFILVAPLLACDLLKLRRNRKQLVGVSVGYLACLAIALIWGLSQFSNFHLGGDIVTSEKADVTKTLFDYLLMLPTLFNNQFITEHSILVFIPALLFISHKSIQTKPKIYLLYLIIGSVVATFFLRYFTDFDLVSLTIVGKTSYLLYEFLIAIITLITSYYIINSNHNKINLLSLIFGSSLVMVSSYLMMVNINTSYKAYTVVDKHDIEAFNFINNNIPDDEMFINNAFYIASKETVVYPSDGGLWIEIYTGHKVAHSFLNFNSTTVHTNYQYYTKLKTELDDKETLEYFKNNGYNYLYIDQGVFAESITVDEISTKVEIVFESGPVKIIKL